MLCGGLGLSLFLVRPLMLLGPRAPLWLFLVCGIGLLAFYDPVCRALNPGDPRSLEVDGCQINLRIFAVGLILFGVLILVRQFQLFRKHQSPANGDDISK
jgi:hypothetical protein